MIFLGVFIVLTVATLLFWDESSGIKTLGILAIAITLAVLWVLFHIYILKKRGIVLHREHA